jgi:single-strand DNA-binding protein
MTNSLEVTLIGRLGRDPEVRNTNAGQKIVNLRVATSESWKDKSSGERQERTEWHSVVVMNDQLADVAEKYLRKGSLAMFRGKLQTRKWSDKGGQDRYSTEVLLGRFDAKLILLDPRSSGDTTRQEQRQAGGGGGAHKGAGWDEGYDASKRRDLDDEVPF